MIVAGAAAGLAVVESWHGNEILTAAGWTAAGVAVGKSVLTAALSYLARITVPPSK